MTKRIFIMFVLLALAVSWYFMQAKADGGRVFDPTHTAQPSRPATSTPSVCQVKTGVDNGAVNLRQCAGTGCQVIRILTEGERLTVTTAGAWNYVTTANGVTGWLNSNYCK